jgi:hypothetical protein
MRAIRLFMMSVFVMFIFGAKIYAQVDSIDYLRQKTPGYFPEEFADGIISTGYGEFGPVFSPNGKEMYFSVNENTTSSGRWLINT